MGLNQICTWNVFRQTPNKRQQEMTWQIDSFSTIQA